MDFVTAPVSSLHASPAEWAGSESSEDAQSSQWFGVFEQWRILWLESKILRWSRNTSNIFSLVFTEAHQTAPEFCTVCLRAKLCKLIITKYHWSQRRMKNSLNYFQFFVLLLCGKSCSWFLWLCFLLQLYDIWFHIVLQLVFIQSPIDCYNTPGLPT